MDLSTAQWRKSSRSGGNGGDCVEVATAPSTVAIRDSKDPDGFKLLMSRSEARAFSAHVKSL